MDYNSPEDEEFFGSIGRFVLSWSQLEAGIDFTIMAIYQNFHKQITDEQPISLKKKIKFLKKVSKQVDGLQAYTEEMQEIAKEVGKYSEKRHNIIHGFAYSHPPKAKGGVSFMRIGQTLNPKEFVYSKYDSIAIMKEAIRINALSNRALLLAGKILRIELKTS